MEIPVGTQYTANTVVDQSKLASAVGSGLVDVFATPMMIALLEQAASTCIAPFLEPGQASVGAHVNVSHSAATPPGMQVQATATVREVAGRRVEFDIVVRDAAEEIGRGTHTRFVIDRDRFTQKALAKSN